MMKLEVHESEDFGNDIKQLPPEEAKDLMRQLHRLASLFKTDRSSLMKNMHRPFEPELSYGFSSTMYLARITPKLRVILTFDEDPLFEVLSVNLLRVINADYRRAFRDAAVRFYESQGIEVKGGRHAT